MKIDEELIPVESLKSGRFLLFLKNKNAFHCTYIVAFLSCSSKMTKKENMGLENRILTKIPAELNIVITHSSYPAASVLLNEDQLEFYRV